MAETEPQEDLSRSIAAILCDAGGALLVDLVTTDSESFQSVLTPILDMAETVANAPSAETYRVPVWLTDLCRAPNGRILACDADGAVHHTLMGDWVVEPVTPGRGLRVVRALPDGTVLAAGTAGTVHLRGPEGWVQLGEGFGQWITGLDGRSADDFAICGDAGLVAQRRGGAWDRPALPTDATLNAVLALEGGYLIGGAGGVLFRGTGEIWEDQSRGGPDIHALARRGSEVWAACGPAGAAQIAADGAIEIVRTTFAAYVLHAAGPFIAFAGNDLAVRFDGTDWRGRRYG